MRCQYCHNPDTWDRAGGNLRSVDDVLSQALRYRSYWGEKGGITVSGIGVLVFTGLTAWDAQKIKRNLQMAPDADEGAQKIALLGALSLYLDFINLFLYLLRFFGNNRN